MENYGFRPYDKTDETLKNTNISDKKLNLKQKFIEAVKEAIEHKKIDKNIKYCSKCCPDIIAGANGEFWFESTRRRDNIEQTKIDNLGVDEKTIVVILESPHIYEFKTTTKTKLSFFKITPNPALGSTGINLQKYFTDDNLKHLLGEYYPKNNKYRVILMNTIQYQCSLGLDTKIVRDYMWFKMWFGFEFYESFKKRLKEYKPDIIINLCTLGDHREEKNLEEELKNKTTAKYINKCVGNGVNSLKETGKEGTTLRKIVSDVAKQAMQEINREVLFYEGNHPSSWKPNFDSIKRNIR